MLEKCGNLKFLKTSDTYMQVQKSTCFYVNKF